jgi:hypothetical protein
MQVSNAAMTGEASNEQKSKVSKIKEAALLTKF